MHPPGALVLFRAKFLIEPALHLPRNADFHHVVRHGRAHYPAAPSTFQREEGLDNPIHRPAAAVSPIRGQE